MNNKTKRISWVKAARKDFEKFPDDAKTEILRALTIAAEGQKADIAKPLKGLGPAFMKWHVNFVPMHTERFMQ